jgi:hypothetical protein
MVRLRLNKVLTVVFLTILFVLYMHHDYAKWGDLGRDAFMNYQARRFDNYMAAGHPRSLTYFGTLAVVTLTALVYEMVAAAFSKILPKEKS